VYQFQYFVYFHDVLKVDAENEIKLLNSWFVANKPSLSWTRLVTVPVT